MIKQMTTPRFIFVCCAILLIGASRLLPHPFNFTPVLAMGLFAGAMLSSFSMALLIPLAAMFLSDIFLGFHNTMWGTYAATAVSSFLGYAIRNKLNIVSVSGTSVASAILFFLVSNFAVWAMPTPELNYPQSFAGLIAGYESALPFFRATLFSNLLYTGLLFGAFHLAAELRPNLKNIR
ncbi:MAG: hypothetical protein FD123_4278 [Bacteroidetes bacterium]|nr:MAG: hypothetical protein FD123_4278 [Bacteroidota bacterium]